MILFYSWGLVKIAGPPSLVILARATSPCQAGACVLIWAEPDLTVGDNKEGRRWKVANGHSGCKVFSMSSHVTGHHVYWARG